MSNQSSLDDLARQIGMPGARGSRRVPVWFIVSVVISVILVGGLLYYNFMPLDGPIPDGVQERYTELPRDYTAQDFPRLGDPNAPVLVEDFSSYACPHCQDLHTGQFANLLDEIAAGQVQYVFVPVRHIGSGAEEAAMAALCAGQQGQFWEMTDALFHWQDEFRLRVFDERRIKTGVDNLGLDRQQFDQCYDNNYVEGTLDEAEAEFRRRDLSGTPSVFVNGEATSIRLLENEIADQIAALDVEQNEGE
ncbi:MAG: thioredoxin domain-containing protein [Chloroflexi bacterium]|nr:thioredoxin domain-containing protein [Chloroflexota bacterium]